MTATETKKSKTPKAENEDHIQYEMEEERKLTDVVVEYYSRSVESDSKWAYKHLGYGLYHSIPDAQAFGEMLKMGFKPKDALDHYNMGCHLIAQEKFGEAVKSFSAAVKMDPQLKEAWYNLALAQERDEDVSSAKKSWKELLELLGDHADAEEVKQHLKELS